MSWFWKVRIYNTKGHYGVCWVETSNVIEEIDIIQDHYLKMTGCKMLLEGMTASQPECIPIKEAFLIIWKDGE